MTPKNSIRFEKYLSTYQFYSNSISFRIISSKAFEKFKNVQNFQLNQLANGRFYFSSTRREILLLKYDMWSRCLAEIENYFIEMSGNEVNNIVGSEDLNFILSLANKTTDVYKEIMLNKNIDYFDIEFTKIWLEIHESVYLYMLEMLKGIEGYSYEMAFTLIVDLLIKCMQYTLIEIYELDSIICKRNKDCKTCEESDDCETSDFVIICELSESYFHMFGESLAANRLNVYKKYFDIDSIFIKNYTDENIPKELINDLEKTNINIDYKKTLIK